MQKPPSCLIAPWSSRWFRNEIGSDKALAIQHEFLRGGLDIGISGLTFYETAQALRYCGDYHAELVRKCLESIADLGVAAYPFDLDVLKAAVDGSFERGINVYDAYLIALAKNHHLTLVTADEKLFARVKHDDTVLPLSEWSRMLGREIP